MIGLLYSDGRARTELFIGSAIKLARKSADSEGTVIGHASLGLPIALVLRIVWLEAIMYQAR